MHGSETQKSIAFVNRTYFVGAVQVSQQTTSTTQRKRFPDSLCPASYAGTPLGIEGGNLVGVFIKLSQQQLVRFWQRVKKSDACWEWIGPRNLKRYGEFYFNGKVIRAHRISWTLAHGDIPIGMCICHHCDNPPCVRPDHLFVGTHQDNMRDFAVKRRSNYKPEFQSGEHNSRSILSAVDVQKIVGEWSRIPSTTLSEMLHVSRSAITDIRQGRTWSHITGKGPIDPRVG